MPQLGSILKAEILRLSRKVVKQEVGALRSSSADMRRQVGALKAQVAGLQKELKVLQKAIATAKPALDSAAEQKVRFSAKRLAAHRAKLGLSAKDYGRLAGVSALTIYNWEAEKARPRQAQLQSLAAVRGMGKRTALQKLGTFSEA